MHIAAIVVAGLAAVVAVGSCVAAAFGWAPWLSLTLTFGDTVFPGAGAFVQVTVALLVAALALLIPGQARVLALENSHRRFHIGMEDVSRAYHLCHTADRAGMFTLSSEFDAVRERLAYLRDHPDLSGLEPGVLEVAAQMSQQARHLADVYSEAKVLRAREFLRHRQAEVEAQQERIVEAMLVCDEIRKWARQVTTEETRVAQQLDELDRRLQSALPALGYMLELEPEPMDRGGNVVTLPKHPAAE